MTETTLNTFGTNSARYTKEGPPNGRANKTSSRN